MGVTSEINFTTGRDLSVPDICLWADRTWHKFNDPKVEYSLEEGNYAPH